MHDLLAALAPRPLVPGSAFDSLDLEVRRTGRERRLSTLRAETG